MPFKFPYTNFQELNLDWIIKKVKDLSKQIEDDSSIVSEYIDRLIAVEDKADNAEATATAADARATGANTTANSALTLATQAKQTAEIADLSTTLLGLKIGDLSSLFTTAKDTIVNAINEVWSIFHNATAVTNVTPAGTDPAVTYSNGVFTFDLPEGGDPDAVTHAELDAAIDGVEDTIDELSEELDDKADVIIDTASGDIATFPDGTATPLKSLVVNVEPVQAGSGDPSPSNVRPISGWTGCEVYDTGHNVWDEEWEVGALVSDGTVDATLIARITTSFIGVVPGESYYFPTPCLNGRYAYYDRQKSLISYNGNGFNTYVNTIPSGAHYLRITLASSYGTTYNHDISINYPSTDTEYHAYNGNSYSVTFGETVLGGNAEVIEGNLSKNRWSAIYDGTEAWYSTAPPSGGIARYYVADQIPQQNYSAGVSNALSSIAKLSISDGLPVVNTFHVRAFNNRSGWVGFAVDSTLYPTVADFKALLATLYQNGTPAQVVAVTDHPTEITITPTPVTALKGYNNIWSDAGAVEVTYRADTKGYIDKLIAQVQALALGG